MLRNDSDHKAMMVNLEFFSVLCKDYILEIHSSLSSARLVYRLENENN